jgi:hypothetical protein
MVARSKGSDVGMVLSSTSDVALVVLDYYSVPLDNSLAEQATARRRCASPREEGRIQGVHPRGLLDEELLDHDHVIGRAKMIFKMHFFRDKL